MSLRLSLRLTTCSYMNLHSTTCSMNTYSLERETDFTNSTCTVLATCILPTH